MPRMAEFLTGSFVPESKKSDGTVNRFRTHSRANSGFGSHASVTTPHRRLTLVETESGHLELEDEHNDLIDIIQEANMDGVRHLKQGNSCTRALWCAVIIVFIFLALFQIYSQVLLYHKNPVATNIEAEYPESVQFPTVAVCNNNQFRLTYVTGAQILNRKKKRHGTLKSVKNQSSTSVFDTVIENTWDMDAVRFLRNAAHWKSRMILGCTWPNGTNCKLSDFKAVWTVTGLCWAINTDVHQPVEVTGSGAAHGLRLLLNVESYERVDACTPHFRTKSLPGLKILIYNQTYVPVSSLDGVNVPSGYSMDVPFKMQIRNKLPGVHCIEETEEHLNARNDFDSEFNVRTCSIRRYMTEIERVCNCSLRRAYNPNPDHKYAFCNVDDYFGCVEDVVKTVQFMGRNAGCLPPCQVIDYTAWQDMNRLPQNLLPALIEEHEEEDENEVWDDIDEERYLDTRRGDAETFSCSDAFLDEIQVSRLKRDAHRAYEKQSRYQEDIFLRSKRLILRVRAAIITMSKLKWGWHGEDFMGIYERLNEGCECFAKFSETHGDIVNVMRNPPPLSEEKRASQIHYLIDPTSHKLQPNQFKTIGEVKARFGDRVDEILNEIQTVLVTMEKMWTLFEEKSYHGQLSADLTRMDRIAQLMTQYEIGHLQRRAWAEKMQSRQMRHFFEEDFYDDYYHPIAKDLDQTLMKTINEIENEDWPKLKDLLENGGAIKTGAILFFEDPSDENLTKFRDFMFDAYSCTTGDVKNLTQKNLKEFKRAFRQLQASYSNLFKKELPDYLENFEFGSKFVSDNFAMVNIFLHQMHIERWSQDRTYTFWSLACDVGGALGLFLGASLLTIIEIIWLCFQYGFCGDKLKNFNFTECIKRRNQVESWEKKPRRKSNAMQMSYDPSISDVIDKTPGDTPLHHRIYTEELGPKRSIWSSPYIDYPEPEKIPLPEEDYEHEPRTYSPLEYYSDAPEDYPTNRSSVQPSPNGSIDPNRLHIDSPEDRLTDIVEENSQNDSDPKQHSTREEQIPPIHPLLQSTLSGEGEDISQLTDSASEPQLLFRGHEKFTTL